MHTLIADMVQEDLEGHSTIDQVVTRFDEIQHSLVLWKLRAHLVLRREDVATQIFKEFNHLLQTTAYIILQLPSVPTPTS